MFVYLVGNEPHIAFTFLTYLAWAVVVLASSATLYREYRARFLLSEHTKCP